MVKGIPSVCLFQIDDFRQRSSVCALEMTIEFSLEINCSLQCCSRCCAEAAALYLKSDDLELKAQSLVAPITRPAFGTGTRLLPSGKEKGTRPLAVMIIGERHLNHTEALAHWHSLPLIVFSPSLHHYLLFSCSLCHTFPLILFVPSPHQASHRHPSGHHARSLCRRYPWHLER